MPDSQPKQPTTIPGANLNWGELVRLLLVFCLPPWLLMGGLIALNLFPAPATAYGWIALLLAGPAVWGAFIGSLADGRTLLGRPRDDAAKRNLWAELHIQEAQQQTSLQAEIADNTRRMADAIEQQPGSPGDIVITEVGEHATNVVGGKDNTQVIVKELHLSTGEERLDLTAVEQSYLKRLYNECNELPLADDASVDDLHKPQLQRVYVDLNTQTPPPPELIWKRLAARGVDRPSLEKTLRTLWRKSPRAAGEKRDDETQEWANVLLTLADQNLDELTEAMDVEKSVLAASVADMSVFDLLATQDQAVLLGDPGSGKSTLTRRLGGVLAALGHEELFQRMSDDDRAWAQRLHALYGRQLLPVRVVLSRWARRMAEESKEKKGGAKGCADDLIDECVRIIGEAASFDGPRQKEHFIARLNAKPPAAMLLLDGLDEVADVMQRKRVLNAIGDFHATYGDTPMLVTCRVRPYTLGKTYKLPLTGFELAPLGRPAIGHFLARWYAELTRVGVYKPEAAEQAKTRLLKAIDDPDREDLAEMAGTPLLLTMMARVNYKHGLPDSRAALYEAYVNELLLEWDRKKQDDPGGRETRLDLLIQQHRINESSLKQALNRLAFEVHGQRGDRDTVDIPEWRIRARLEAIHAGSAEEKAAWAVSALKIIDDRSGLIYATEQADTYVFTHRSFQEYLAARWMAGGGAVAMASKISEKLDDEQWREAIFLAFGYHISVLGEYGIPLVALDNLLPQTQATPQAWNRVLLLGEVYVRLLGPQRAGEADPALSKTSDRVMKDVPRLLTTAMQNRDLPARQRLDAGLLVDKVGIDPPGLDDFLPLDGWFTTPDGDRFRVGRYPVTNKQYRRFMKAGGYSAEGKGQFWSEKGRSYNWTEPRYWDNSRLNRATQPVVGVSWYEANAYCAWLTAHLREEGVIGDNEEARLPTQAEWEAAARSSHGKAYPWGSDEFDPARANTEESDLNQTTPVYMYPNGATPDGIWDMSGNVWEWMGDQYLKGGSWALKGARTSASARPHYWHPSYGDLVYGFRVVVGPISR